MLVGRKQGRVKRSTSCQWNGIASALVDWVNPWRRYVDEVQDNLLIDTLGVSQLYLPVCIAKSLSPSVLRTLCSNPHGLFWAGDTAQVSITYRQTMSPLICL